MHRDPREEEGPENRPLGREDRPGGLGREGESRPGQPPGEGRYEEGRYGEGHREPERTGTGWGVAALVLAILSLLGAFFLAFFNLVLAVPALVLGIVARRKGSGGLGLAAIIVSIVAILLGLLVTALVGAVILTSPEFQQELQQGIRAVG